ncbi:MAG: hypothetical protein ACRDSR_16005 [Pseudonocardiaceae bacterium]
MQVLPTNEGKAPAPGPIRAMDRWRAAWRGRRDATSPPSGEDLSQPHLNLLRAEADAGQQAVSAWLHDKLVLIDQETVRILILLEQHRRDPAIAPEPTPPSTPPPADTEPRPMSGIPQWLREARQVAATHQAFERRVRERDEAEQRLGELGSARHHLIEIARTAALAHVARYGQLVALYDSALLRRQPDRRYTSPPPVSMEPWLHGDLPLLALDVEGELAQSYRWFLKEFATRTSPRQRPVLEEVPRAS